jgi:MtN3 and saliva related transmembrane protein
MLEMIGYAAGIILTVGMVPQAVRLVRHGAQGVAFGTWGALVGVIALWLGYGLQVGSLPIIVANGASLLIAVVIVAAIVKDRRQWNFAVTLPLLAVTSAGAVAVLSVVSLPVVATAAVVISVAARYPQVAASWRTRKANTVSQVAVSTWVATGVGHVLWLAYGVAIADAPTVATNFVLAVSSVLIVAWEHRAHIRRRLIAHRVADAEAEVAVA